MARQSKYSEHERKNAVERAFGGESSPTQVAAELGVSVPTLYRWAQAPKTTEPDDTDAVASRLITAAQELLRDASYPDITVEDVARHAGVPLRTAFARYPSKRTLFGAAVDSAAEAIASEITARAEAHDWPEDPIARLTLFLEVISTATYAHPEAHVLFRDLGVPIEDRFAERWHDAFRQSLTALLAEVEAEGLLRAGIDIESAGTLLARTLRGLHATVFEGTPRETALDLIARLPLLVIGPE